MTGCPIYSAEAVRRLRLAMDMNISVYIYGATGFGKTTAAAQVLPPAQAHWISCRDSEEHIREQLALCRKDRYTVADDLQLLEDEELQQRIVEMLSSGGYRMILIGRPAILSWLSLPVLQSRILAISEEDLRITPADLSVYCQTAGLAIPPEQQLQLLADTEGNSMALGLFLQLYLMGSQDMDSVQENVSRAFHIYLDENILSHWRRDVLTFLMQVSVVDRFTIGLAEQITGGDNAADLLSRAQRTGNFLTAKDGVWELRPMLQEVLRERALRTFGRRRYDQLLCNAGRWYELSGFTAEALELYTRCGDQDCIRALLIRDARKHPGVSSLWDLRHYYQALSEEDVSSDPVLIAAVSMLYSVLMDTEKSEYWYDRLQDYTAAARGVDREEAQSELDYLDVGLPHWGSRKLISILTSLRALLRTRGTVLRPVSLTNNQPSVMNGGKDFCEWTRNDTTLASTLGPLIERLLGRTGVGLIQAALGESTYEKGGDPYRILNYLTRGQSQSESSGSAEMVWVCVGLQAKLALTGGDMDYAQRLTAGMLARVREEDLPHLARSVEAFGCWLSLYGNETGKLRAWLETAPDETQEFCTLHRYLYMIRIHCYIALGEHTAALTLIRRMLAYAEYAQRTYIRMECGLLTAVILRRTGQDWRDDFMQALDEAAGYQFTAIISEKGAAILPLLSDIKAEYCRTRAGSAAWFDRVLAQTKQMARRYPDYLKGNGVDISDFSETALSVLRMQAAGCTTKEIAEALHITPRTVKYHAAENYRKLDARNMVDAVQIAQALHII